MSGSKHGGQQTLYTRDVDKLLIEGYIRNVSKSISNQLTNTSMFHTMYTFHTKVSKPKNCFFVYGTLRDDEEEMGDCWHWTQGADSAHLAIVYGFKMYGGQNAGFPGAKKTNTNSDYMFGRVVQFENDELFKQKMESADGIEGYNPDSEYPEEDCFYIRENIECFVFDELDNTKLKEMGYYDENKIIDFTKESRMKQEAFIYWMVNDHPPDKTPNNDWIKRFVTE